MRQLTRRKNQVQDPGGIWPAAHGRGPRRQHQEAGLEGNIVRAARLEEIAAKK